MIFIGITDNKIVQKGLKIVIDMIDNINLLFQPRNREDYILFESILSKYQYKRNLIIESIHKNINLYIFTSKKFIIFKVFHLNEFMGLREITNRDYQQFVNQFEKALWCLGINIDMLKITRCDYKIDVHVSPNEMQEYLYIMSKLRQRYYSMKKRVFFSEDKSKIESVYYKGGKGFCNINIYDKQTQLSKRGINDPIFNDVLRFEIQVKSKQLTEYCKRTGVTKELINFFHTSVRKEFFESILIDKFLYSGDYYNIKNVRKQMEEINATTQHKIVSFCKQVALADITEAIDTLSRGAATKYIKELTSRNINPITIKNFDCLLGIQSMLEENSKEFRLEKLS